MSREQELREKARKKNKEDKDEIQDLAEKYKEIVLSAIEVIIDHAGVVDYVDIIFKHERIYRDEYVEPYAWYVNLVLETNVCVAKAEEKITLKGQKPIEIEMRICGHEITFYPHKVKSDPRALKKMKELFEGVEGFKVKVKGHNARVRMYVPK